MAGGMYAPRKVGSQVKSKRGGQTCKVRLSWRAVFLGLFTLGLILVFLFEVQMLRKSTEISTANKGSHLVSQQITPVIPDPNDIVNTAKNSKQSTRLVSSDDNPLWSSVVASSKSSKQQCESIFSAHAFESQSSLIGCSNEKSIVKCKKNPRTKAVRCRLTNLIMDTSKMAMSEGGEDIESVRHRNEDLEYPSYKVGSMRIGCRLKGTIPSRKQSTFYQSDVLTHLRDHFDDAAYSEIASECEFASVNAGTRELFILTTRYEYANLYHTATDWFNVFQTLVAADVDPRRVLTESTVKVYIVFLDGHSKGSLDRAWRQVFTKHTFHVQKLSLSQLSFVKRSSLLCMREVWLAPPGYIGGLALESMSQSCLTHSSVFLARFNSWFISGVFESVFSQRQTANSMSDSSLTQKLSGLLSTSFLRTVQSQGLSSLSLGSMSDFSGLLAQASHQRRNPNNNIDQVENDGLRVSLICRKDYVAHPRARGSRTRRKFANDEEVWRVVRQAAQESAESSRVDRVYLEGLEFEEQVMNIAQSDVLVGTHGAGLTHLLFLPPHSCVVEIVPHGFSARVHFKYLSNWSGHKYLTVAASGSDDSPVRPNSEQLAAAVKQCIEFLSQQ